MPKAPGGLTIFDGFKLRRTGSTALNLVSTIPTYFDEAGVFQVETFKMVSETLTVIDSGGATGGWVSIQMGDFNTGAFVVVSMIDAEVFSVGSGIGATGTVNVGIGSAATTTGSLSGTPSDLGAIAAVVLTGGAGTDVSTGPTLPVFKVFGTDIHLNIGVADADITADADVVLSVTCRTFWLDLTRGA